MNRIFVFVALLAILTGTSIATFAQTRPAATARPTPPRPAPPQPTPVPATRSAPAQPAPMTTPANVPPAKIALVDTTVFGDEKVGITRYLTAVNTVQRGFEAKNAELRNLQNQIKVIADDLTKLSNNPVVNQ